jgi:hypothetical protein
MIDPRPHTLGQWIGLAAYVLFEHWLGRTDKVRAGSSLDLIWNMIEDFLCWIISKFK